MKWVVRIKQQIQEKGKKISVTMVFIAGVIFLIGLGGVILLVSSKIQGRIIGGRIIGVGIMALAFFLFLATIKRVPFPEVWVIDRLGTLIEKRPGYHIIVWFLGIERKYLKLIAGIQYSIPLFSDREDIIIDLKMGGQIILKDPRIWILIRDPKKTAATALNFEEQIREISENRVAGILNNLTYDEVIAIRIPETIRDEKVTLKKKLDMLVMESEGLQKFLKECEIEYKGFTLDDFDFDKETTGKRRERITTEMGVEIAENVSRARVNEMSAISKTAKNLVEEANFPLVLSHQVASERYQDHLVGEKGNLQKIIWTGRGSGITEISSQWELGKKVLREKGDKKEVEDETVKEEKKEREPKNVQSFWRDKRPMEKIHQRRQKKRPQKKRRQKKR